MKDFKSIEEAQEAFKKQGEELDTIQSQLTQCQSDLKTAKSDLSESEKKLKAANANITELQQIIADIRSSKSTEGSKPYFKQDKDTYDVLAKSAHWNGKIVTAEQICKDKQLQTELIKANVGFIVKREN